MAIQLPAPITPVAIVAVSRLYPHVDNIADWQASQSIHLLWDRIHALEERLKAVENTQTVIVTSFNTLLTAVQAIQILAEQAYAKTQAP